MASAGGAITSSGGTRGEGSKATSSTSRHTGPAGRPCWPLKASFSGSQSRRTSPTTIICRPSERPGMMRSISSVDGRPRLVVLSKSAPLAVQPE